MQFILIDRFFMFYSIRMRQNGNRSQSRSRNNIVRKIGNQPQQQQRGPNRLNRNQQRRNGNQQTRGGRQPARGGNQARGRSQQKNGSFRKLSAKLQAN